MSSPLPATIHNKIHDRLARLTATTTHYLATTSATFTSIFDELNTLGKVDASGRSVLLSLLYAVCGDRGQADYYLDNARRIHAPAAHLKMARITYLMNLGYCSEALDEMREFDMTQYGVPKLFMSSMPSNGAFHTMNSLFDQAIRMHIADLPKQPDLAALTYIMDQWGDTDDDYCSALDFAGQILREHRMFFQDNLVVEPIESPADGSASYIRLIYKVDVDLDTSIDMTTDFVDRLARSGCKIPPSLVFEFEGTKE